jgi:hypothetical protein
MERYSALSYPLSARLGEITFGATCVYGRVCMGCESVELLGAVYVLALLTNECTQ